MPFNRFPPKFRAALLRPSHKSIRAYYDALSPISRSVESPRRHHIYEGICN
jgi:hypothetical protein